MEYQSLQTVEARIRVGIGRRQRMCSIRSELRQLNSVIFFFLFVLFETERGGGEVGSPFCVSERGKRRR